MSADVSEILKLSADLATAGPKMVKPILRVMDDLGRATATDWADIARTTAGAHGRRYPNAITATARGTLGGNVEVEIGPEAGRKQGSMARGFEFGSVNQPAHLDGLKATTAAEPRVSKALETTIGYLLP